MRATDLPPEAIALIVAGFCAKLGVVPLHLWLPLAHAAAPAPASAVLSGAMIKAGLFGLITLLPFGTSALPVTGDALVLAGVVSIGLAAAIGVTQRNPKAVLAYSSIGQMGLAAVALGVALGAPQAWPVILPALLFFAAHHALTKGALFLGVGALAGAPGNAARRAILVALAFGAAALAAAPFTAGALAKAGLKYGVEAAGPADLPLTALTLSSFATTLLMARFLVLMARHTTTGPSLALPWLGLAAAGLALPFSWNAMTGQVLTGPGPVIEAGLPIAGALILALVAARALRLLGVVVRTVPPGEVLALFEREPPSQVIMNSPARPKRPLKFSVRNACPLPSLPRSWQAGATATVAALVTMVVLELSYQPRETTQRVPDPAGLPP